MRRNDVERAVCLCEGEGSAMNQPEDTEEEASPPKITLHGEHDSHTKAKR